jgi:lactobin A/cerein 7B family class IIb bacteriocin
MKQNEMNSQKAQELTKEELEQVNGGSGPSIQDILKSTTAILMFP